MPTNIPGTVVTPAIEKYIADFHGSHVTDAERGLDQATMALHGTINAGVPGQHVSIMEISTAQSNFLSLLTHMLGEQHPATPMKALDIGTFTGRSALAMAKAMPNGGEVITCDIDNPETKKYLAIAEEYWKKAGVRDRITPMRGPALHTMDKMLTNNQAGTCDIVFIDADKPGYGQYYEKALQLVREGGLVVLDNVLWSGRVANPDNHEPGSDEIRALNEKISQHSPGTNPVLLSMDDGVMVVQKCGPHHYAQEISTQRAAELNAKSNSAAAR